jgi:hypothetical protein
MNIFDFWSEIAPDEKVHPRDRHAIDRVEHGFDLRCLPGCFIGALKKAPLVLLYLSPGFDQEDVEEAEKKEIQALHVEIRKGNEPLRGPEDHKAAWAWWSSRSKPFGNLALHREKIAFLNINAYHSKTFPNQHVLAALPSCRVTLDWAQGVLFPQAERGERVVICMRGHQFWGLGRGRRYGVSLFAPEVNRSGFILRNGENNAALFDAITLAARDALGTE